MRLRTSRRRHSWVRVTAFSALVLLGGAALWSSLRYSEVTHATRGAAVQVVAPEQQQEQQQQQQPSGEAATQDAGDNLAAWTQLTDVTGKSGSGSTGSSASSGGGSGGSAAAQQQQQQASGAAAPEAAGFVTVELRVPKAPPSYNSWVQAEDMLLFHRRALQQQLEQTYIAMALAAAAGRAFILPRFQCFCHQGPAPLPRCRAPGRDAAQFPEACAEGDVLAPLPEFAAEPARRGAPLDVLPHSAASGIDPKDVLQLRPSATIVWPVCAHPEPHTPQDQRQCSRQGELAGGGAVLDVPPSLNDTHLLPFLAPYQHYKLWRLDLSDVGSPWHAFAGWDCAYPARQFDQRMSGAAQPWPAPSGGGLQQMGMTTGRKYSDKPDMKEGAACPAVATTAAAAGARRLRQQQRQEARQREQQRGRSQDWP